MLSTLSSITQGVVELQQHPDQLRELKENPSLVKAFVDELCRFHTASAFATKRVAKVDIELAGKVCDPIQDLSSTSRLTSIFRSSRLGRESSPPLNLAIATRRCFWTRTPLTCIAEPVPRLALAGDHTSASPNSLLAQSLNSRLVRLGLGEASAHLPYHLAPCSQPPSFGNFPPSSCPLLSRISSTPHQRRISEFRSSLSSGDLGYRGSRLTSREGSCSNSN